MIDKQFLQSIAEHVNAKVAKVVLNGKYQIDQFEVKKVTENVLALNYIVRAKDLSVINKIELKDPNNATISTNIVNIPVTTDQRMIQEIEIKEG